MGLGVIGTVARLAPRLDDSGHPLAGPPELRLSAEASSDVSALEMGLGETILPRISKGRWQSRKLATTTHSMLAFNWRTEKATPHIHVSSRVAGVWQAWRLLPLLHDLPDPGSADDTGVFGTELVWIGDSDGIQVHVSGSRPENLTLVLLYPAPRRTDAKLVAGSPPAPSVISPRNTASSPVPRPELISRKDWGADESWRTSTPSYNSTIEQAHIHHTAGSNDYSRADVPALIRGMYRYHTSVLGWSDIGYNFLVDRFGRAWVGRAGGAGRPVRGAHTLGFNATSTGIAVIGNFEVARPTSAILDAIAAVAAWKLDHYGRGPARHAQVVSEGSDKFPAKQVVELPVIDGHRDTNDTACPGRNLYETLPVIRQRTKGIVDSYEGTDLPPIEVVRASTVKGAAVLGESLDLKPGKFAPSDAVATFTWLRDGVPILGANGLSHRCVPEDVGTQLTVQVSLSKQGYRSVHERVAVVGLVRARTAVSIRATGRRRRALIRIHVTAPASRATPTGQVLVRLDHRTQVLDLIDGRATAKFRHLVAGPHTVDVTFEGSTAMRASHALASVNVG